MKLTKTMKKNLFNIICNKLTHPTKEPEYEQLRRQLQEWIFNNTHPSFKEYFNQYGSIYSHSLYYTYDNVNYHNKRVSLEVNVPIYSWFDTNYCDDSPHLPTDIGQWDSIDVPEQLKEIAKKLKEFGERTAEFDDVLASLKETIFSCNTDTALRDMYPDFVQYFNAAGITKKYIKTLPSTFGLPENLTKFGLKLTTKETIEQETRKENQENE